MRNWLALTMTLSMSMGFAARADDGYFQNGVPQDRVPGRALIKLRGIDAHRLVLPKASDTAAVQALKNLSGRTGVDVSLVRAVVFGWALVDVRPAGSTRLPNEDETLGLVAKLQRDSAIEFAQDEKWMRPQIVPNDPGFPQMWHLSQIGAENAWDITTGVSTQRVGIVDTGLLRAHEDVGSRAVGGFDFMSGQNNDGNGRDSDFNDVGDQCGAEFHGTHTAGTVGAAGNNGIGVTGLNWSAGLMIARTLGDCGGDITDIGEGAAWLAGAHIDGVPDVGANKVGVMNLSLGSASSCSPFEQQVVDFANQQGVIFVVAAGNDGGAVGSPANCTGALAVAAHGPQRNLTDYSSFGTEIDIVAPGGDQSQGSDQGVLSSVGPGSDNYAFYQGTSMAAPHVTGSVSLMQALNPTLSLSDVIALLQSTGTTCGNCQGKKAIVLDALLAAVTPVSGEGEGEGDPPPPVEPTDDPLEDNDSFDNAKNGVGCNVSRTDLIAAPDDQDWFILDTVAGQHLDITMTSLNGADLDLYLLDGPNNTDIIASSETNSGNEHIAFDSPGGSLRVVMNPFFDQTNNIHNNGPYTLSVSCDGGTPVDPPDDDPPTNDPPTDDPPTDNPVVGINPNAPEDDLEDNDLIGDAQEMFCNEERTLTLKDDDFFSISVRDGDVLSVNVTAGDLDLETTILDAAGVLATGTASDVARSKALAAGTYKVQIHPVGASGVYQLQLGCKAGAPLKVHPTVHGGCSSTEGSSLSLAALMVLLLARRRR